jgi:hypothetical protein
MTSTFPSTPVIPNHFNLAFLLNPENQPLFACAFLKPEHEYLEEQYHTLCQLQDSMWKLDNLLKFTINNMKNRGISGGLYTPPPVPGGFLEEFFTCQYPLKWSFLVPSSPEGFLVVPQEFDNEDGLGITRNPPGFQETVLGLFSIKKK